MTDKSSHPAEWPQVSRPDDFARLSPRVQRADDHLRDSISRIQCPKSADIIAAMLAPLHESECGFLLPQNNTALKKAPVLCQRLSTPSSYNAWWGAPAAATNSHHAYPGGWLLHTATNLHALEMLIHTARALRGIEIDSDDLYTGMVLHDSLKPRLLLWENDGSPNNNQGEYGHHVAAIAEAFLQGASERVLVLLAGVHSGWWQNRDTVREYLQRAAELVGDPALERIADSSAMRWELQVETEIMYQAERAWYSSTRIALQQIVPPLDELLQTLLPAEKQQAARWWIHLHCDELELARQLGKGAESFSSAIRKVLGGVDPRQK